MKINMKMNMIGPFLLGSLIFHMFLLQCATVLIVSSPLRIGGVLVFKIWTKRGVMRKILRDRGLVEKGVLLESEGGEGGGGFQIASSLFFQKSFNY